MEEQRNFLLFQRKGLTVCEAQMVSPFVLS